MALSMYKKNLAKAEKDFEKQSYTMWYVIQKVKEG